MRPLLLCRVGDDEGLARLVGEQPLLIGRARDCDVALTDPQSSRRHSRVILRGETLLVEDLESVLGTLVNGRRLAPHVPEAIGHRDVLTLADTIIDVVDLDCVPAGVVVGACIVGPGDFRVPLRKGSNVIGTAPDCDLVVDDVEVPPRHADLVLAADGCRLVREPASPPLFVNGEPVVDSSELASGDVFQLSPHAYFGVEVHVGTGRTEWAEPAQAAPGEAVPGEAAPEEAAPEEAAPEEAAPAQPAAFGASQAAETDEGERTHASPSGPHVDTTNTLRLEEIKAALDKARARHAAEIQRSGGVDDTGARSARTPIPISVGNAPPRPRMATPPPDLRAARREAAVRIHVVVPGEDSVIVLLREGAHLLGRSERCRVRLGDPSVMNEHAEVSVGPQGIRVRALSPDGLVLRDGRRLSDSTVAPGERIQFGVMEAWFEEL